MDSPMYVEDQGVLDGKADQMVVESDYVVAVGRAEGYSSLIRDAGRVVPQESRLPIFHVLKPTPENPLKLYSASMGHISVTPDRLLEVASEEVQPADVYSDKSFWNIATFLYVPGEIQDAAPWDMTQLKDSFRIGESSHLENGTLLFSDGPIYVKGHSMNAYHAMPSQVTASLWDWMTGGQKIFGGSRLNGTFDIGVGDESREICARMSKRLEDNFGTQIVHEDHRRHFPQVWKRD